MYYTIYKITNKLDGKIYIGKHQTQNLDDSYMGSGKLIQRAINKYGIENFEKEILFVFDNEDEMNAKEAEIVTEEFVKEDTNYNLCPGGHGGFGYIRNHPNYLVWQTKGQTKAAANTINNCTKAARKKFKEVCRDPVWSAKNLGRKTFLGKTHTEEWKKNHSKLMKAKSKGQNNSQYGTMWITNGIENKKIKKVDIIPEGWYKGRTVPPYVSV